jgi:MSHA pilin protein MshA
MVRKNEGFTLVELMVVIVIIGILAALAIPRFTEASTKAKISEIPIILAGWDHAVIARHQEVGELPTAATQVTFEDPGTTRWFAYGFAYPAGGPAVGTANVAAGKQVGPYAAGAGNVTSSITAAAVITHNRGAVDAKYLGNWD